MTTQAAVEPHPFWRHLRQSIAGEGVGLFLSFLVLPIAARRFGPADFGRYVVAFRVLALLQPTALLGMGVALTRSLATTDGDDRRDASAHVMAAFGVVATTSALVGVVALVWPGPVGRLVFGSSHSSGLLLAITMLLFGSSVWSVTSSALRGTFAMREANVLYPIYLGVVPLLALALRVAVTPTLVLIGAGWTVISLAFAVRFRHVDVARVFVRAREMLSYGVPRVPGEFALFGLLSIPSIAAVRSDGVVAGGHVALAMSLVTMGGAACAPLASVLLPHAARAMADPAELRELTRLVRTVVLGLLAVLVATAGVVAIVAPTALRIGLGKDYVSATSSIRLACLAVPAYGLYVSLRSVLDAAFHRPVTTVYSVYGFVVFAASYFALTSSDVHHAVLISFVAGVWVLALATFWRTLRLLTSLDS